MAGCLKALGFWKKRSKGASAAFTDEQLRRAEKKLSIEVRHVNDTYPPRGIPVRPNVNPEHSTYSTPVYTRWVDSTTSTKPSGSVKDDADINDAARRKKAEQEEQERLDFFQMM
ncbi:hypothetical protein B0I37DRAFT_352025 [Chaetomium sp. MPI-CAGE-AT-0009]|nr:hypothetical protein B0I37DRAFT_352025 [Chaetomium sp. MPI-CAGE-AT-0009]